MITEGYPLQWPIGRARTDDWRRKGDPFKVPEGKVRSDLAKELRLMGVDDFVISCNLMIRNDGLPYQNQRQPEDPGVALYFIRKGQEICISCDQYAKINTNLRAIGKTVEAIRGMERWGTEEMVDRAFTGFTALPESIIMGEHVSDVWHEVLQVLQTADYEIVKAAYNRMLHKSHPDTGGSDFEFQRVQNAWKQYKELNGIS